MPDFNFNNWRSRLLPATFRGVPFFVSEHEYTFGRRSKVYELWNQDAVTVYDQGGKAEYFEVKAYVVQNPGNNWDYWPEKWALIDALRKKGFGILMHPFLGKLYVSVFEEQTASEDLANGGICEFKLKFVQNQAPVISSYALAQSANVAAVSTKAALIARDSVTKTMGGPTLISGGGSGGRLIVSGKAALYQDSLLDGIKNILGKMNGALSKVKGVVSSVLNEAQNLVSSIISTIDQYLDTPCQLSAQMDAAAQAFLNICGIGQEVIEDVLTGTCSGLPLEEGTTLDGESVPQELGTSIVSSIISAMQFDETDFGGLVSAQQANARALIDAAKIQLLAKALEVAIRTTFLQRSKYESMLAQLQLEFDALLYRLGEYPDTTDNFVATEDMRNTFFLNALNRLDLLARQIVYVVPAKVTTSLHVAYNRYGDLNRDAEVMSMNPIVVQHPGFLPGGESLVILNE